MADATYGAFLTFIETVTAKDDKTVTFALKYPFESLLKGRLSVVKVFPRLPHRGPAEDHAHRLGPLEVRVHQRR